MKCVICGEYISDAVPYEIINDGECCGDCAYIHHLITDEEYIKKYLFWIALDGVRVALHENKIYITAFNQKFPFEVDAQAERKTAQYKEWRTAVFIRDDFRCQICGKVGGTLNAHHIKSFSEYPNLRYVVSNGVTLCEECHKDIHRRKGAKGGRQTK